jgi:hypothetical protein
VVFTGNGKKFRWADAHPYELFLEFTHFEHRKTWVRSSKTGVFVEQFHRTALDEFFQSYSQVEVLFLFLEDFKDYFNKRFRHLPCTAKP